MSYQGYYGWFKSHTTSLSDGQFWLNDNQAVELGEPVILSALTGFIANPKNKIQIESYAGAAGAYNPLGVSLDIRYIKSGVSDEDIVLRPERYMPREIAIMKIGICPIKNTHTGIAININETVVPSNGGCEPITQFTTGVRETKHTLGKGLEYIAPLGRGLVWVNPNATRIYPTT